MRKIKSAIESTVTTTAATSTITAAELLAVYCVDLINVTNA